MTTILILEIRYEKRMKIVPNVVKSTNNSKISKIYIKTSKKEIKYTNSREITTILISWEIRSKKVPKK